ncbi:gephyrin-like molybdotransferase Glp [Pseudoxanthomonas mexicana]|uniref:molybdopterin molybdotransferase MoeA n=1 Tax=Pseudoxanthomonas mexicana TaxID=128785 RepID=UPI00398AA700
MIGHEQALAILLARSRRLESVSLPVAEALDAVLAEAVASPQALPPFDNAAMDGFAVDSGGRALEAGLEVAVGGEQAAGDGRARAEGGAWEIMTGARIPDGLDTVVPVEQVEVLGAEQGGALRTRIRLAAAAVPGQHVRRRGEDVDCGTVVMRAGERLQAPHLAMLSALGVSHVQAVRRPRVAIIATGRELVADPAQALASGQIRDSNSPFLHARLAAAGAQVIWRVVIGDDTIAFQGALDQALAMGADVIVSTGAVSQGRYDFVPSALRECGADIGFHKVRIRPGKPLLFATLPGGQLYFGLPGNPVSTAVGLRFFVEPALAAMLGLPAEVPLRARLEAPWHARSGLRMHLHARLCCDAEGRLVATVLPQQQSFRLLPLLQANAWVVVPEAGGELAAGQLVDVYGPGHWQPPMLEVCT